MKWVVIGAHLQRDDVEPIAEALPVSGLFLSTLPIADERPLVAMGVQQDVLSAS